MTYQEHHASHQSSSTASLQQITSASLDHVLAFSPDALFVIDEAGTILKFNEHLAALFGYAEEELRGVPFETLLPTRFRGILQQEQEPYRMAPHVRPMGTGLELYGLHKDGTQFPVDISLRPVLFEGAFCTLMAVRDMTERHAAQLQRIAQDLNLKLPTDLLNLVPSALSLRDPLGRIIYWNEGAERLYGWTEHEVVGRLLQTLLETRFPQGRSVVENTLKHQGQWEGEAIQTGRDGQSMLVESHHVVIRDRQGETVAIMEMDRRVAQYPDLEQMERTPLKMPTEREALLLDILDQVPNVIFLIAGREGRLLFANRRAQQLLDVPWQLEQPLAEMLKANELTLCDAQGHPLPMKKDPALRVLRTGETANVVEQLAVLRPNGQRIPVLITAHPFQLGEYMRLPAYEPVALVIHEDITWLKEAEKLKEEFVALATHELRTPLTVLSSYVDLFLRQASKGERDALPPRQQKALAAIKDAIVRLSELTNDLLDVTCLQAGRLVVQPQEINLVPLVQEAIKRLQQTTSRHHIEMHSREATVMVIVDAARMHQILTNLLGNAIKYSPQGGAILVGLEMNQAQQQIILSVKDYGIGIPSHQHARIFGRFVRAENAQAYNITGTGLGLYLCREFAALMEGTMWFESEEGNGSTFFLSLPLATKSTSTQATVVG